MAEEARSEQTEDRAVPAAAPAGEHPFHRHKATVTAPRPPRGVSATKPARTAGPGRHPFGRSSAIMKLRAGLLWGAAAVLAAGGLFWYVTASGRGSILVADGSDGITVSVNGRDAAATRTKTGYEVPLFAGQYRVTVTKPHYAPFSQTVTVTRGKASVIRPAFAFEPASTSSQVSTVAFMRPSADQKTVFYVGDSGTVPYRLDVTSQERVALSLRPISGIRDVQWSSEPTVALITRPDGVYLREIPSYDYVNQTMLKIGGTDIVSPVWDPLNPNRMAFAYQPSSGERSLVFADRRLSDLDRKADITGIPDPKVIWSPDDSYVLLVARSSDASLNDLWIYAAKDGSLHRITSGGSVTDASFSPDESVILYQTGDGVLRTVRPDGSGDTALSVSGQVARTAWKDASTLILPGSDNQLTLYELGGGARQLAFTFPSPLDIQAMFYFPDTRILVFNTKAAIYSVDLTE